MFTEGQSETHVVIGTGTGAAEELSKNPSWIWYK
jgi:hypothetical protein